MHHASSTVKPGLPLATVSRIRLFHSMWARAKRAPVIRHWHPNTGAQSRLTGSVCAEGVGLIDSCRLGCRNREDHHPAVSLRSVTRRVSTHAKAYGDFTRPGGSEPWTDWLTWTARPRPQRFREPSQRCWTLKGGELRESLRRSRRDESEVRYIRFCRRCARHRGDSRAYSPLMRTQYLPHGLGSGRSW